MSVFKTDGTFTSASLDGSWRKSFPIPGDNISCIVEQEFMMAFSSFAPIALNTPHATFATAYLVAESPLQDLGGGIARWTRTYAQVPSARDEPEDYSTYFPGLLGTLTPPYNQYWIESDSGRDPRVEPAQSRLHYEYFLCGTGLTYETWEEIPIIPAQVFTLVGNDQAKIDYLLPEGVYWSDSVPSKEEWVALVAGGGGMGEGANAGEFIAEKSRIERYLGNIWCRITRYVKAK